ncbi:MAG: hypothetical protein QXX68_02495 [Candidatus Pacearchaeota archaeon]
MQDQNQILLVGDPSKRRTFLKTFGRSATSYFVDSPNKKFQIEINGNYPNLYAGSVFLTKSGHYYSLDEAFRFHGRDSIEGARVGRIAGVPLFLKKVFSLYLGEGKLEEELYNAEDFLMENGRLITIGEIIKNLKREDPLCLALILDKEDFSKYGRVGFVSSPIVRFYSTGEEHI